MTDRYNVEKFAKRSIEDLKDRYYKICGILGKVSSIEQPHTNPKSLVYFFLAKGRKKSVHIRCRSRKTSQRAIEALKR